MHDVYTHDLTKLLKPAGLKAAHDQMLKSNIDFNVNWNIVKDWSEQDRYKPVITEIASKDMYAAIVDPKNGDCHG